MCAPRELLISLALTLAVGCSSSAQLATQRESADELYAAGVAAMESKDFATAVEKFTGAIEARGLNPDEYANTYTKRALANAALGNFDAAHEDLDLMERGAPNLDEVYAARAFVYFKQGKSADAKAEFNKARQVNPQVQVFRE